jgi:hypothetical protein
MNANTKATSNLLSDAVQKQLIGTWKLTAFEDRKDEHDPNSEWTYPYGIRKDTSSTITQDM